MNTLLWYIEIKYQDEIMITSMVKEEKRNEKRLQLSRKKNQYMERNKQLQSKLWNYRSDKNKRPRENYYKQSQIDTNNNKIQRI
jgi:hypothetical protein